MRNGVVVPKTSATKCIDMMMTVLNNPQLHINAAQGYKSTGATVALDGSEDHLVVKEAGEFFRRLDMRRKIDEEVRTVRHEVAEKRLFWTYKDVKSLIKEYPKRKGDEILAANGEDWELVDGECPYEDAEEEAASEVADAGSDAGSINGDDGGAEPELHAEASQNEVADDADAAMSCELPTVPDAAADAMRDSNVALEGFHEAIEILKRCGAVKAVHHLEAEVRKELKRQRLNAQQDPAVAGALAELKAAKAADERRRIMTVIEANRNEKKLARIRKEKMEADAKLKLKQKELVSVEAVLEAKHAIKRFAPSDLGDGHPKAKGEKGRKLRFEVLDRLSRLGTGLSPAQRNDWAWFRNSWDTKMVEIYKDKWAQTFCGWMQHCLDDIADGNCNAFSIFVHRETKEHFMNEPMLTLPPDVSAPRPHD